MDILLQEFIEYLKFKLKINNINYMDFVIHFLNTFTAVLSVFLTNFLVRFFFVTTSYSNFNNDLP